MINKVYSQSELGDFIGHTDIGHSKLTGSTRYDPEAQRYTMTGAGYNIWNERDEFQFAWKKMTGDFLIQAQVKFLSKGVDPHRKIGVMIRESLDDDAKYVDASVHGDGLTSLQFREITGGLTEQSIASITHADVLQLEKKGNRYTMSVARFGEEFATVELLTSI